jgi:hypothetical protein
LPSISAASAALEIPSSRTAGKMSFFAIMMIHPQSKRCHPAAPSYRDANLLRGGGGRGFSRRW